MKWSGFASASRRRTLLVFGLTAVLAATNAYAQQAPAPAAEPPAQPAAQADAFQFKTPAAAVLWIVNADASAQFETFWMTVKARLAANEKPELKAVADSIRVYKVDAPAGPQGGLTYMTFMDPASPTSYNPTFLLFESGAFPREEADKLFPQLSGSIIGNGISPLPLLKIQ